MYKFSILLLSLCASIAQAEVKVVKPSIEVQGHRGARGRLPENSLPAFEYALQVGVDVLELDLGVSRDKVLVVNHDPFIDPERCLDKDGNRLSERIPLAALALQEIQQFQCGVLPHKRFPQQKSMKVKMPTLEEVFDLVKNSKLPAAKTVRFNIETKLVPAMPELTPSPEVFAKMVLDAVKKYGWLNRVVIQSFDHRSLRAAKKLEPKLVISPLVENTLLNYSLLAKDLKAAIVSPNLLWITAPEVQDLHSHGIRVVPWTANEEKEWARLIEIGVDGIITDYPEECIAYLKSKGLR